MENIRLKDGTVIEIQEGSSEYVVTSLTESVDELVSHFTTENLQRYEILTKSGDVSAIYSNKRIKKYSATVENGVHTVQITLADNDDIQQRIAALEQTVDTLVIQNSLKIENTEKITEEPIDETFEYTEDTETESY